MRRVLWLAVIVALAGFYYAGASEHARVVNTERGRADQSGYLWDAVGIHMMRHGSEDALIGERNRMPVYPWLLSWLYDPSMTPDQYFEVGKKFNIWLSLVLLAVLAVTAGRFLPPLVAANFTLVIGFGYFIFKAGYAQVELLYYTVFFLTFLACCLLLRSNGVRRTLLLAVAAGALAALSQLTKAGVLPLVGIVAVVGAARAIAPLVARRDVGAFATRAGATALFVATFLGVMSPYLLNSKRVFGHYFYNVNTTFYVWYDDWTAASWGVYRHGDGVGWPKVPPEEIPSMRRYLRERTPAQIGARLLDGFLEMFTVSYTRLGHLKYVAMYVLFAMALIASRWRDFRLLIRSKAALFAFLVLYAVAYTLAVSFYKPISGTTLRMLLVHVAPLLFAISWVSTRPPFAGIEWRVAGRSVRARYFHGLVLATVAFDLAVLLRPRLMGEFAGY